MEAILTQCMKYIEENLDQETLSLKTISEKFGYSQYHFSRLFRESAGIPVMEYVKRRRMIRASRQILSGSSILDAALNCGYQTHNGFSKAFFKQFGFPPVLLKAWSIQIGGYWMDHVFFKETAVHETKEILYRTLLSIMKENHIPFQQKEMDNAYHLACCAYKGLTRYSGDDYVTHPLNAAILLAQMEAETSTIIAGMFCDVLVKTKLNKEDLDNTLGEEVGTLISEAAAFDVKKAVNSHQVLLIKLAERLHNMRTVEFMSSEEQKKRADETLAWFLPLAFQSGDERIREELNDLTLKWI